MISSRTQLGSSLPKVPSHFQPRPLSHAFSCSIAGKERFPPSYQTNQDLEPGWISCIRGSKYQNVNQSLSGRRKQEAGVDGCPTVQTMIRGREERQRTPIRWSPESQLSSLPVEGDCRGARGPFSGQGPVHVRVCAGWTDPQPLSHRGSYTQPTWTNGGSSAPRVSLIENRVWWGTNNLRQPSPQTGNICPRRSAKPPAQPSLAPEGAHPARLGNSGTFWGLM